MSEIAAASAAHLRLFVWLSPAFPVGAFAYSHGLEEAVEAGLVHDAETLRDWSMALLRHGSARQDVVLSAEAWRATHATDAAALIAVDELALALCPSRERRLEVGAMGRAFVDALRAAWPEAVAPALSRPDDIAYAVAFGSACAMQGIGLASALEAYGLAFASNLVSAALRLGPIGQTDAQRILRALLPDIEALAAFGRASTLDDLGTCAFRSDLAALRHETLYSRLFRS